MPLIHLDRVKHADRIARLPLDSPAVAKRVASGVWVQSDHPHYAGMAQARVVPVVPRNPGRSWAPIHQGALTVDLAAVPAWLDAVKDSLPDTGVNPRQQFARLLKRLPLPVPLTRASLCRYTHQLHTASDADRRQPAVPYLHAAARWGWPLPDGPLDTFGAVYVISLRRTPQRLVDFCERFPADWPFLYPRWFEAVDGDKVAVPPGWQWSHPYGGSNHAAIGCRASWLAVLDKLIADDIGRPALVMEDDCELSSDALARIGPTMASLPAGWQILYLGGEHNGATRPTGVNGLVRCTNTGRTHAVVVSPGYVRQMRDDVGSFKGHIDHGLRLIAGQRQFYAADPFVAVQALNLSTITGKMEPTRDFDPTGRVKRHAGRSAATLSHGGDAGDLIYALPTIRAASRAHGGADLVLAPLDGTRQRMTPDLAEQLRPLLLAQPYVRSVRYADHPEGFDLNEWRRRSWPSLYNLADRHLDLLDWSHAERETPWITADAAPSARVLIHHWHRDDAAKWAWHARNPKMPWTTIMERYGKDAAFVGSAAEHECFCREVGDVPYLPTPTYLDLAKAIAGCALMVGSNSSPMAIAVGMGKPYVMEVTPGWNTAHFDRKNATHIISGTERLPSP